MLYCSVLYAIQHVYSNESKLIFFSINDVLRYCFLKMTDWHLIITYLQIEINWQSKYLFNKWRV